MNEQIPWFVSKRDVNTIVIVIQYVLACDTANEKNYTFHVSVRTFETFPIKNL